MITADSNYRAILKDEFEARCRRNPLYSLRAFARDLEISPARLSEIFSAKQGLSVRWADRIASTLGYSAGERRLFCDLVEAEDSKSPAKRKLARIRLAQHESRKVHSLQMDAFQVISDWYHFALLELTLTDGFKNDPAWIAKKLGISRSAASLAVERLLRMELLERKADGTLVARDDFTASPDGIPSAALKKYHQQIIEKALSALYSQSVAERDVTNVIFAFDKSQMKEAKELIKKFRRGFCKQLPQTKKRDSVYCLAIQLYQLDESKNSGGQS